MTDLDTMSDMVEYDYECSVENYNTMRQGNWSVNKPNKTMKGKVKSVLANGTFQELYVWEVEVLLEDGLSNVYKKYTKKDNAFISVDDVITFDVNDKGSMKNVEKVSGSQGAAKANETFVPAINPEKQQSIVRQSSLKIAIDYMIHYFPEKKIQPEDLCRCADMFVFWVETGKYPEKPELSEKHPNEVDDLPF